jgi:hypothetical protein
MGRARKTLHMWTRPVRADQVPWQSHRAGTSMQARQWIVTLPRGKEITGHPVMMRSHYQ